MRLVGLYRRHRMQGGDVRKRCRRSPTLGFERYYNERKDDGISGADSWLPL